jgi:type II intron maturase
MERYPQRCAARRPGVPVLSNIYLDRLDRFVETVLLPEYNRGKRRAKNPVYQKIEVALQRARRHHDRDAVRKLHQRQRQLPSQDPDDPGYRRLRYVRYCDDFLLGFAGPKREATQIKQRIGDFLRQDLALELSPGKTLITHARTGRARFLGYDLLAQHSDTKITRRRRMTNGAIGLRVPKDVIDAKCALYCTGGKPASRHPMIRDDDFTIVAKFGAEYRGYAQYYLLAGNLFRLQRLRWVMETSMLKTLANKHHSTVTAMAARYKTTLATPRGPRTCFQVTVHAAAAENHWSRASATSGSSASTMPSSTIKHRFWPPPAATS